MEIHYTRKRRGHQEEEKGILTTFPARAHPGFFGFCVSSLQDALRYPQELLPKRKKHTVNLGL